MAVNNPAILLFAPFAKLQYQIYWCIINVILDDPGHIKMKWNLYLYGFISSWKNGLFLEAVWSIVISDLI